MHVFVLLCYSTQIVLAILITVRVLLNGIYYLIMDLIHYSFAPLILFHVPYTLNFLPYYPYLSIANGAGGVGILELLIFYCFV